MPNTGSQRYLVACLILVGSLIAPARAQALATTHATRGTAIIDTTTGLGGHRGRLGPSDAVRPLVFGRAGVPISGAEAVTLQVRILDASDPTKVVFSAPGRPLVPTTVIHTSPGTSRLRTVTAPLGQDGVLVVTNHSDSLFGVRARVIGYRALPGGDAWPQQHSDSRQSSSNSSDTALTAASLAPFRHVWTTTFGATVHPIVYGSVVYGSGYDDTLRTWVLTARSLRTGRLLWDSPGVVSRLAAYDGMVYVSSAHSLRAVDIATHQIVWETIVANGGAPTQVLVDAGRAFVNFGRLLCVFDAATGKVLRQFRGAVLQSLADGYAAFEGEGGAKVINVRTLRPMMTFNWGGMPNAFYIADGLLILQEYPDTIQAFRLMPCVDLQCRPLWRRSVPIVTTPDGTPYYAESVLFPSPGVIAFAMSGASWDGTTRPATIYRMRLADGALLRRSTFGDAFSILPTTTRSLYIFGIGRQLMGMPIRCAPSCSTATAIATLPKTGDGSYFQDTPLIVVGDRVVFVADGSFDRGRGVGYAYRAAA